MLLSLLKINLPTAALSDTTFYGLMCSLKAMAEKNKKHDHKSTTNLGEPFSQVLCVIGALNQSSVLLV